MNNNNSCINCGKPFEKELLSFISCSDIIKHVQSHFIFNDYILNEILHYVNKTINVTMCHKCFSIILLNKGFNWFYSGKYNSTEKENKTVIAYEHIDIVYQMCFENLITCINNVSKELLCNQIERDSLMNKIFLQYFFGKKPTIFYEI